MAKHRSPEQWAEILDAYESRTGSQAQFCKKWRLRPATLNYHLKMRRASPWPPSLIELPAPAPSAGLPLRGAAELIEVSFARTSVGNVTIRCRPGLIREVLNQISPVEG